MKGVKNDFSMTFFVRDPEDLSRKDTQVLYLQYVHNTEKAILWCKSNSISWDYANVYERRTRKFLERVYNPYSRNIEESHSHLKEKKTWK